MEALSGEAPRPLPSSAGPGSLTKRAGVVTSFLRNSLLTPPPTARNPARALMRRAGLGERHPLRAGAFLDLRNSQRAKPSAGPLIPGGTPNFGGKRFPAGRLIQPELLLEDQPCLGIPSERPILGDPPGGRSAVSLAAGTNFRLGLFQRDAFRQGPGCGVQLPPRETSSGREHPTRAEVPPRDTGASADSFGKTLRGPTRGSRTASRDSSPSPRSPHLPCR